MVVSRLSFDLWTRVMVISIQSNVCQVEARVLATSSLEYVADYLCTAIITR